LLAKATTALLWPSGPGDASSTVTAQRANGATCTIDVAFTPIDASICQATRNLQSNAPSSPVLVQLRGNNDALFADDFEGD